MAAPSVQIVVNLYGSDNTDVTSCSFKYVETIPGQRTVPVEYGIRAIGSHLDGSRSLESEEIRTLRFIGIVIIAPSDTQEQAYADDWETTKAELSKLGTENPDKTGTFLSVLVALSDDLTTQVGLPVWNDRVLVAYTLTKLWAADIIDLPKDVYPNLNKQHDYKKLLRRLEDCFSILRNSGIKHSDLTPNVIEL